MPATVIVGLQWGDEGKGKTTDFLAEQVAMAVRYQGGDNAGHTVVLGDEVFKLRLTPSGVLYPHITSVIGPGVVVNPATLIAELDMLASRGIDTGKVRVSRNAHVIMPYHVALDRAMEARLGGEKVGTTQPGDRPDLRRPRLAARACGWRTSSTRRPSATASSGSCPTRTPCWRRCPAASASRSSRWWRRRWPGATDCGRTWPTRPGSSRTPCDGATTSSSRAPRARSSTSTTAATRS